MFGNLVVDHLLHAIGLKVILFLEKVRASQLDASLEVILIDTYWQILAKTLSAVHKEF